MMKSARHLTRILAALVLLIGIHACERADDFEDGWAAYEKGDYQTALRLWKPLAEQGDADAQFNLGIMYGIGEGVPQDKVEAVKWYRLAAEQGHVDAQYYLGYVYLNGYGVPHDYVQAHMWFNLAATQGLEDAIEYRDIATSYMTPSQIEEAQRLAREWLAAHAQ